MSDTTNNENNQNDHTQNVTQNVTTEEVQVSGEAVVGKVKELIREGNIRRIAIKNEAGKTLLEIPLTFGVVGALLAPQLAALGAVGALIANLSIRVERESGERQLTKALNQEEQV